MSIFDNSLDNLQGSNIKPAKIEVIHQNYEGIAKVLSEFEKLYKVVENKKMLDKCLFDFISNTRFCQVEIDED